MIQIRVLHPHPLLLLSHPHPQLVAAKSLILIPPGKLLHCIVCDGFEMVPYFLIYQSEYVLPDYCSHIAIPRGVQVHLCT
jgi:hypothetical protein